MGTAALILLGLGAWLLGLAAVLPAWSVLWLMNRHLSGAPAPAWAMVGALVLWPLVIPLMAAWSAADAMARGARRWLP
jgi:hypothetical protein